MSLKYTHAPASGCKLLGKRKRKIIKMMLVTHDQVNEGMWVLNVKVTCGSRPFTYKIKTCFSQKPLGHFQPNFICML